MILVCPDCGATEQRMANARRCRPCQTVHNAARPSRKGSPAYHAAHYQRNRVRKLAYVQANKERRAAYMADYIADNKEALRAYTSGWMKANRDKCNASMAKRRAQKLLATPGWLTKADFAAMAQVYVEAGALGYHVDHITPLVHPDVCGLHVPWNLQLLTKSDNCRKGNRT